MIFVTVGSQKFQFNRLLEAVDKLVEKGTISDSVFAQIGFSDYTPKNYKYKQFLDRDEFADMEGKADVIITHGGTGAIIGALKKRKRVIAVARLSKYGEHVDDHQLQLIEQFADCNLINQCSDLSNLDTVITQTKDHVFDIYKSNTAAYLTAITDFIDSTQRK